MGFSGYVGGEGLGGGEEGGVEGTVAGHVGNHVGTEHVVVGGIAVDLSGGGERSDEQKLLVVGQAKRVQTRFEMSSCGFTPPTLCSAPPSPAGCMRETSSSRPSASYKTT